MFSRPTLESVIRRHVNLPPAPNSKGFFTILCKVCNDHGHKGKRAGFLFSDNNVAYNCFNCGSGAGFNLHEHKLDLTGSMKRVMTAYGIGEEEWRPCLLGLEDSSMVAQAPIPLNLTPATLDLPDNFYQLQSRSDNEQDQLAMDYLAKRGISYLDYPFYLARWNPLFSRYDPENQWHSRLIIPYYVDSHLVFWQGRDLTGKSSRKYLSCFESRDNVIGNWDNMKSSTGPVFVTEGWFDCFHINGCCVMSNKFTPEQLAILSTLPREKIIIPDRQGNGKTLALQAIEQGWKVSCPDIGSCKDVNEAMTKYGKLYTVKSIRDNIFSGDEARITIEVYCQYEPKRSTRF